MITSIYEPDKWTTHTHTASDITGFEPLTRTGHRVVCALN